MDRTSRLPFQRTSSHPSINGILGRANGVTVPVVPTAQRLGRPGSVVPASRPAYTETYRGRPQSERIEEPSGTGHREGVDAAVGTAGPRWGLLW